MACSPQPRLPESWVTPVRLARFGTPFRAADKAPSSRPFPSLGFEGVSTSFSCQRVQCAFRLHTPCGLTVRFPRVGVTRVGEKRLTAFLRRKSGSGYTGAGYNYSNNGVPQILGCEPAFFCLPCFVGMGSNYCINFDIFQYL